MARITTAGPPPAARQQRCRLHVNRDRPAGRDAGRSRALSSRSTVCTGPTRTRRPARRSSPASSGADGQLTVAALVGRLGRDDDVADAQVRGRAAADARDDQRLRRPAARRRAAVAAALAGP